MKVEITNEKIESLRTKLENLIAVTDSLQDNRIVSLSQKLDKLICNYYL